MKDQYTQTTNPSAQCYIYWMMGYMQTFAHQLHQINQASVDVYNPKTKLAPNNHQVKSWFWKQSLSKKGNITVRQHYETKHQNKLENLNEEQKLQKLEELRNLTSQQTFCQTKLKLKIELLYHFNRVYRQEVRMSYSCLHYLAAT